MDSAYANDLLGRTTIGSMGEELSGTGTTDVLEAEPPDLSPAEVAEIAARLWGLEGVASSLASERDQNFLIDAGDRRAVLKIANAAEDEAVIEMEIGAALHAKRVDPGLPIALPRPLTDGDLSGRAGPRSYHGAVRGSSGATHRARLYDFMPGEASADPTTLDHDALREFGRITARLGRALRAFFHPAAGRILLWDVQHALRLRPLAARISDPGRRALVGRVLDHFEKRVEPRLPLLRSQVIHGDLSLDNTTLDSGRRVTGILDFGDMSHTALACDISSAWASLVWGRRGEELYRAAAALLDGYRAVTPLEPDELAVLADLFAARAAAAASISAVRVARHPDNAYIAGFDAEAWPLLELYDEIGPEEAARRFGARDYTTAVPIDGLLERRRRAFGPALLAPTYDRPLHMVRAEGVWMYDADGRRYLDAYNNVPVVGHSHPRVVEAVTQQARTLNTNMRYLHGAAIELAERLLASLPQGTGLDTVVLLNSGSEANDLAWRLATAATGHRGGLVSEHAYHGISAAVADLSPELLGGHLAEHVETFPPPEGESARAVADFAAALERLEGRGIGPAMTVIDGGFTSDGIHPPPDGYLDQVVRLTHEAGGLYVADEVQVGHGRTGAHLWSFAAAGITPDLVALGKPMGNGYPVAALITRAEIARLAGAGEFFSTFGGNPPASVAALTVLEVIADEDLVGSAGRVGAELRAAIERLARDHDAIEAVRGWGLLVGVELADPNLADRVKNGLRERGVLVGVTGAEGRVLKVRPPLVFGAAHAELLLEALDDALGAAVG